MTLLFTCREVTARMTDFQEGALPLEGAARVRLHLMACPSCRTLLRELKCLPDFVPAEESAPKPDLDRALGAALARLGQPRAPRPGRPAPIPHDLEGCLGDGADLPLRILAEAHAALGRGEGVEAAPHLPASVMARLPRPETWTWRRQGAARVTELVSDAKGGPRLILMQAPPHFRILPHTHHGSESILVLRGDMEDGDSVVQDGQWVHHGEGSSHAPVIFSEGCWALIREEGEAQYQGLLGRLAGVLLGH